VSKSYLEPVRWYGSLPTYYVYACMLLTDADDHVLLVKPGNRDYWAIPGGAVKKDETPHDCAERGVAEEPGLTAVAGDLLVVSWSPPLGDRPRAVVNFLFDGGTVHNPLGLHMQGDERGGPQFFTWEQAETKMPADTAAFVSAARQAREDHRTIYLPSES
jgi:8-oxo-dGTP diphosphatase